MVDRSFVTHDLFGFPSTRTITEDGYLLVKDVRIARTGEQIYIDGETPLDAAKDGLVRITRPPEEVFSIDSIDSFNGRPLTSDHPDEMVGPENWKDHVVGSMFNVRRGTGIDDEFLMADILIGDGRAIDEITSGKREVSVGYSADYEQLEPGKGIQRNIRANHLAIVDKGRCGPRCAIGDREMSNNKRSVFDRIRTAFKAKDEAAFEAEIAEAMMSGASQEVLATGAHTHVHVNLKGLVKDADKEDDKEEKEKTADADGDGDEDDKDKKDKKTDDALKAIMDHLGKLQKTVDRLAKAKDADKEDEDDKEKDKTEDDDPNNEEMTGDSAELVAEFKDTVSRAEILSPGLKLPALDRKASKKAVTDSICALRRKALIKAFENDAARKHVAPFVSGKEPTFDAMPCGDVKHIFIGASELARASNNKTSDRSSGFGDAKQKTADAFEQIREINRRNAEFWNGKR
jgi:hypothetical protein